MRELEEEGKTTVIVIMDGSLSGLIAVVDTVKASASPTVAALKKMGVEVVMLTGDNWRTAAMAKQIGMEKYVAEGLPQQKAETMGSLQKEGRVVAMESMMRLLLLRQMLALRSGAAQT